MRPILLLGVVCGMYAQAPRQVDFSVLASRAQSFAEALPNLVCTEELLQKELRYTSRLKVRNEDDSLVAPPPKTFVRKIVSELGYALDGGKSGNWREVRKVMEVDGRTVTKREKAREKLVFGLRSDRDRERYRLLEEFRRYGLDVTVTDYSLSLLLFRAAELPRYRFQWEKEEFAGADKVQVFSFRRMDEDAAVTVFEGKKATHARIQGRLWLREDGVPVKIQLVAVTQDDDLTIRDEGTVEYSQSSFGPLVAARVDFVRRVAGKKIDERVMAEAEYVYANYQRFGAEAELKFETLPEEP
jgi:hypothetical protein